jgi:hypothetical protein
MNFTGKMKGNIRVVCPLCIQEPFALCEVHKMPIFIFRDISLLEPGEVL